MRVFSGIVVLGLMGLVGCSTIPTGPNVTVYKGTTKTFEAYQHDDVFCREYAKRSLGVDPETRETQTALTSAAILGASGAALGAIVGAVTGSPGAGAAIGGAAGVVTGGAAGSARGQRQEMTLQGRYDSAYLVCMHAQSHQVPGVPLR